MTPDVNVLVAALLESHPQHAQARRWLTDAIAGSVAGAGLAVLPMVAVGFVRVVTSLRAYSQAVPTARAVTCLRSVLAAPGVWMPGVGPEWDLFEALCLERGLRGGVISDAWIAAAVMANGLHLVTFDADFRRLLPPDRYTLLVPKGNLQEQRAIYSLPLAA